MKSFTFAVTITVDITVDDVGTEAQAQGLIKKWLNVQPGLTIDKSFPPPNPTPHITIDGITDVDADDCTGEVDWDE